jgi:hypothetical protein
LLSISLLAFAPFLRLALIRRQARDWAVLAAYAAAVVLELVLVSVGKGEASPPVSLERSPCRSLSPRRLTL